MNHPARQPLTAQEVNYWKRSLARLLKVGLEFEFNLPEQKSTGTCKGKSYTCPCVHWGKEDYLCWTKCVNEPKCATTHNLHTCAAVTYECREEDCATCTSFSFSCIGSDCSNHIPACVSCNNFKTNCIECEHRFDPSKNPDSIREECTRKFNPSGSYGIVSASGVHDVVTDGSLLGKKGMEVITTGRRIDYYEFYKMASNIISESVGRGAYTNERCSIHMHILNSYYGKTPTAGPGGTQPGGGGSSRISELERSLPEIVLANAHQLLRRYQNAITWMTTGLDDPNHLTRWEKFRVSILDISAIINNMREVCEKVVHQSGGNKYGWANYKFCEFDKQGDVRKLHVEIRTMDGLLAPSAVAAVACLYYAIFIKAVEISRYGVLEAGSSEWLAQSKIVKNALMNNCTTWDEGNKNGRFSDTSNLAKYTDILVAESFELISQLKHILTPVGPAYDVLEKLAETPCSIRRCDGLSWEEIESQLVVKLTEEGELEYEIKKIIDTREVKGVKSVREWMVNVASLIKSNTSLSMKDEPIEDITEKVNTHFMDKQSNGEMIWADKIGSVISI